MTTGRLGVVAVLSGVLSGCATPVEPMRDSQTAFWQRLQALCGRAVEGRLVTDDAADRVMAGQRLIMHVAECSTGRVRVPFHVGDDRSRTWVISRTPGGLRLKHDHRHEDGSADVLTQYGGDTAGPGTAERQEFPVDAGSIALFGRTGRSASVTNVWALEVTATGFAYELRRPPGPNVRFFRVEFDLDRAIAAPPLPWGWRPGE